MLRSIIIVVFILTMLSGYARADLYEEHELEKGQTSNLQIVPSKANYKYDGGLALTEFDGKNLGPFTPLKFYRYPGETITAGPHTIKLSYVFDSPEFGPGELLADIIVGFFSAPFGDLPGSECIGTLSFNADAGRQYMIKAIHAPEGLPITLSVIQYEGNEEFCQEPKLKMGGVTSCSRSPIIEVDEVSNTSCNIIEKRKVCQESKLKMGGATSCN